MSAQRSAVPVLLVTGASRGIGRAIAVRGAALGYTVAVHYRANDAAARESAALCEERRVSAEQSFFTLAADLADPAQRRELIPRVLERTGRLDALVNNAGMAPRQRADVTETSETSFRDVLETNLTAPFFLAQRAAAFWLADAGQAEPGPRSPGRTDTESPDTESPDTESPDTESPDTESPDTESPDTPTQAIRYLVFIGSVSAETVSLNRGEYCIAKAGLAMACRLWARRLAPHGIGVVEIRPGIIDTDMTAAVRERYDTLVRSDLVPQHRWGTPDDVARAVEAVLEGKLDFSAGSVIHVDGGMHISVL